MFAEMAEIKTAKVANAETAQEFFNDLVSLKGIVLDLKLELKVSLS